MSCATMHATKMWRSSLQRDMGPAQQHEIHVTAKGCWSWGLIEVAYTKVHPPHNNIVIYSYIACKSRVRAPSPEHPPARAAPLLQLVLRPVILFSISRAPRR
jgi:hypothetical protein